MGVRSTNTTQSFGSDFYRSGSDVTRAYVNQVYTEDVFHTQIYDGTNNTQTITNGIDLASKGGLVWLKQTELPAEYHALVDTERGRTKILYTADTNDEYVTSEANSSTHDLISFNSDGFTLGQVSFINANHANKKNVSWTFRKQPGFFDIVTYDGDNGSSKLIPHNLGSVPGFIIVKCTSHDANNFNVYHRSAGATKYLTLDTLNGVNTSSNLWNDTEPTSTHFTVGQGGGINQDGRSYVAYLFAHDEPRFGDFEDQDIIKCGKATMPPSGDWHDVDLGWEPQWILIKPDTNTTNWEIFDSRRGIVTGTATDPGNERALKPNTSDDEANPAEMLELTGNGFRIKIGQYGLNNDVYYVAIRKGIKKPTDATKVFNPVVYGGSTSADGNNLTQGFAPVDLYDGGRLFWTKIYTGTNNGTSHALATNKTGPYYLQSNAQDGHTAFTNILWGEPEFVHLNSGLYNQSGNTHISWNFKTAAGFFDIVTYEGTGTNQDQTPNTVYHSLGVKPELIMCKRRDNTSHWVVWSDETTTGGTEYAAKLNTTGTFGSDKQINTVTSTTFNAILDGAFQNINVTGSSNIALLFASCPGVSKVGKYSGNTGNNVDVDCGFTSNARFVMIKRTDSEITTPSQEETNWWIFDEDIGITSGNDYVMQANTADARVTANWLSPHPDNKGFRVNSGAIAALNATGGTYLFLAIA